MPKLVIDMQDKRPVWAMPPWAVEGIADALPTDWSVSLVRALADGSGDGGKGASPEAVEAVRGARIYLGFGVPAEILREGSELQWVHSGAAGVGGSLTPEMKARALVFTNSAGIHAIPMAETVLAMILHFARGLDFASRGQAESRWWTEPFLKEDSPIREVGGSTVGIVGYGGVGREVARRVRALGARVLGLRRRPTPEAEEGVEVLHGQEGMARVLAESDYLVVSAPATPATRGLLGRDALGAMKPAAVLVNVSRGSLVDEDALCEALRGGRLRGAALDVFRKEPLPPDHPLWTLPGVLITPHVSAVSRGYWKREVDLVRENIRRFLAGEPLRNVVDRELGY